MSILSQSPDLTKIIKKAVDRIGENHSLSRDNKGVTMMATEIEKDRKEFRSTKVIEESLKAAADEMAEKMVLENTINGMIKDVINEQDSFWDVITYIPNKIKDLLKSDKTKEKEALILAKKQCKKQGGTWGSENSGPCQYCCNKRGERMDLDKRSDFVKKLEALHKKVMNEQAMNEQFKEMGDDIKKFWKWLKNPKMKINKVTWHLEWPKLPKMVRTLFLKRYKKKYRNCTFTSCPDFDKLDNNIKKTELSALETGGEEMALSESTTATIKKIVNKKLKNKLTEAKKTHPGYDTFEKAVKISKTENDKAMKAAAKKFKEYEDFNGNTKPEFPHQEDSKTDPDNIGYQYYRNNDDDQEFIDDFAHPGLIDFDINNLNMEKLTDYLEGSSNTGNAQEDEDGELLGNVGYKSDLGEKMKKSAERRKEKIAANKASMSNLRGYTPDVQKVKQVKEEVTVDLENMKKLWNYKKITQ